MKKIAVIHCGSVKAPLINLIIENSGIDTDVIPMSNLNQAKLDSYFGIIISGAPILLLKEGVENYIPIFESLKTYSNPILGICFGHQILGALYGGSVHLMNEDRDWQTINFTENVLFHQMTSPTQMTEDHCEYLKAPDTFTVIGSSPVCQNEAMQHKVKPIWGVQFHPETSNKDGEILLQNFIKICETYPNKD